MLLKLFRLMFGLLCGYFAINFFPPGMPFYSAEYFGGFILNPLEFLAGTMAVVFGMFLIGGLLRDGAVSIHAYFKGKDGSVPDIFFAVCSIGCNFLLASLGAWQTAVFFCFCLIYGMISLVPTSMEGTD